MIYWQFNLSSHIASHDNNLRSLIYLKSSSAVIADLTISRARI